MSVKPFLYLWIIAAYLICLPNYAQTIWSQPDKALIVVVEDDFRVSKVFDISEGYGLCILDEPNSKSMTKRFIDAHSFKLNNNTLTLKTFAQSFPETFYRLKSLPQSCNNPLVSSDPKLNFETLWKFYQEYYPSFKERFSQSGVTWEHIYQKYVSLVNAHTDPKTLYRVLTDMLSELHDGHVELYSPFEDFDYNPPAKSERPDKLAYIHSFQRSWGIDSQDIGKTNEVLIKSLIKNFSIIDSRYLTDVKRSQMQTESDENVPPQSVYTWGMLKQAENTGYLRILQELYYAGGDSLSEQYYQAEKTIDQIVDYFKRKNIDKLVIDLRYNVGGYDAVNHYFIRYLLDKKRVVKQQISHYNNKWTAPKSYYLTPFKKSIRPSSHLFPIIVLTSSFTSSAGEDLTLELKSMLGVTQLGYKTDGIFADTHTRVLPNGWVYQLPFNKNLSGDGVYYESIGITPDIELDPNTNYLNRHYIENDRDIILDKVILNG